MPNSFARSNCHPPNNHYGTLHNPTAATLAFPSNNATHHVIALSTPHNWKLSQFSLYPKFKASAIISHHQTSLLLPTWLLHPPPTALQLQLHPEAFTLRSSTSKSCSVATTVTPDSPDCSTTCIPLSSPSPTSFSTMVQTGKTPQPSLMTSALPSKCHIEFLWTPFMELTRLPKYLILTTYHL